MKKVIIIGGGLAGLSAGSYLQMNGYETEIFELGAHAGGLCNAWRRGEYLIDGCIHWFVGCNPEGGMYKIWSELFDIKNLPFAVYGEFASLKEGDSETSLYGDMDRLQKEWTALSPADAREISFFANSAKKFAVLDHPVSAAKKILALLPLLLHLKKLLMPVEKYALRFQHPLLRDLFAFSFSGAPLVLLLLNASWFYNRSAGYPEGGAKELVGRITARYQTLGGRLHLNSRVANIIVENDAAAGVELANGEQHRADLVISAADGRDTILKMLGGRYTDKKIRQLYHDKNYEPKEGTVYVSLGVARAFSESAKPYVLLALDKPLIIDHKEIRHLGVTIHNFDPKAAPVGKTVLSVMLQADGKAWIELREQDRETYNRRKQEIADRVIEELDKQLGEIKNKLEMVDVATPATFARYTNNWNGVPMAWQNYKVYLFPPDNRIKGLQNFYMCGQWTGSPGLPGAVSSGRKVAMMITKQDGQDFHTSFA